VTEAGLVSEATDVLLALSFGMIEGDSIITVLVEVAVPPDRCGEIYLG
jgi:hypothetical protein